jgi:hypothetical protein
MESQKPEVKTPIPEVEALPVERGAGEGAVGSPTAGGAPIEFGAPCCASVRECRVRAHYVVSLTKPRILRTIEAVRCYRGISRKYKFYPTNDVALVSHYVSNRGVHYLTILWKPEAVEAQKVIEAARRALGLETTAKLVIRGMEVVEEVEEDG